MIRPPRRPAIARPRSSREREGLGSELQELIQCHGQSITKQVGRKPYRSLVDPGGACVMKKADEDKGS